MAAGAKDVMKAGGTSADNWLAGALLCRAGGIAVALPLSRVAETMRPLPVRAIPGAPEFVAGVARIRGRPVPVVDLGLLLGRTNEATGRLVTVRADNHTVAVAVESIDGVRPFAGLEPERLPPLLTGVARGLVEAIAALDSEFLALLDASRLVPPDAGKEAVA